MQAALGRVGCELPLYHAKLSAGERDRILGRFTGRLDPPLKAVICTSAFSMGLDVADVRAVINWQHPSAVEDYLQEFGRSGRDGRPALSLLFGDGGRESGLLQWMPNKTAEDVVSENKRTYAQAQETLRGKTERIDEMARLTAQQTRCFRAELIEALAGPPTTRRRTLALRIVDWAFSTRTHVRSADACCDFCNPELVTQLRAGAYTPGTGGRGIARPRPRRRARLSGAAGAPRRQQSQRSRSVLASSRSPPAPAARTTTARWHATHLSATPRLASVRRNATLGCGSTCRPQRGLRVGSAQRRRGISASGVSRRYPMRRG